MSEEQEAEAEEKPNRRRRSRRRGRRGGKDRPDDKEEGSADSTAGEDGDAVSDDGEVAEEEATDKPREGGKHRKIPTWGEAISVVVDANMSSRAKQPASKPTKGRRGRSKSKPKR